MNFSAFLDRDVNAGFSGGEIKRSELLQLMAQKPDLMLFDEPESGVDMENIHLVGKTIAQLLEKDFDSGGEAKSKMQKKRERRKMGLVHHPYRVYPGLRGGGQRTGALGGG